MKKVLCLSGLLALWLGVSPSAGAQPSNLILLRNVDVVTAIDSTRIELRFNRAPNEKGITYGRDFAQIEFPDTYVDPPKQWINVGDDIIKNIFLYQLDDTTVRMRLFTLGKAEDLKDTIRLSQEGKRIFIQYNIPLKKEASMSPGSQRDMKIEERVIARAEGPKQSLNVAEVGIASHPPDAHKDNAEGFSSETSMSPGLTKDDENTLPFANPAANESQAADIKLTQSMPADQTISVGGGAPNLYASLLKMVAALGILIALLFAALYLIKRVFGKKMGIAGQDQGIRVVTSAYLGPKKSIALVDIAGERIVVGITQDHISMLTKLGKGGEFKEILHEQVSADEKVELQDELWEKV